MRCTKDIEIRTLHDRAQFLFIGLVGRSVLALQACHSTRAIIGGPTQVGSAMIVSPSLHFEQINYIQSKSLIS